jgi:hypothetical protein
MTKPTTTVGAISCSRLAPSHRCHNETSISIPSNNQFYERNEHRAQGKGKPLELSVLYEAMVGGLIRRLSSIEVKPSLYVDNQIMSFCQHHSFRAITGKDISDGRSATLSSKNAGSLDLLELFDQSLKSQGKYRNVPIPVPTFDQFIEPVLRFLATKPEGPLAGMCRKLPLMRCNSLRNNVKTDSQRSRHL